MKWHRAKGEFALGGVPVTLHCTFDGGASGLYTAAEDRWLLPFSGEGSLLCGDAAGDVAWHLRASWRFRAAFPGAQGGGLLLADGGGVLCSLRPDGKPAWYFRSALPVLAADGDLPGGGAAAAADVALAVISPDGTPLWGAKLASPPVCVKAAREAGSVFVADSANNLTVYKDGVEVWKNRFPDGLYSFHPLATGVKTYVLSTYIYSFGSDGSTKWSIPNEGKYRTVATSGDGEAVFLLADSLLGRVSLSGQLLWCRNVPSPAQALAVLKGTKMVAAAGPRGFIIHDKFGNYVCGGISEPPLGDASLTLLEGGYLHLLRTSGGRSTLTVADLRIPVTGHLMKSATLLRQAAAAASQELPIPEQHYEKGLSAVKAGDIRTAYREAVFAYRFYEEGLATVGKMRGDLVTESALKGVRL